MANNRELSQFGSFVEVADSTKLGIGASVGIGTTLPTVQLEVHGDVKTVTGKVGVQTAPTHDLQVYGQTQLDDLNVLGIATFTGAIDANGGLNISGGSALVASSLKVSDLTDNRVVIAGGSGELEDDARFTFDGSDLTVGLGVSGVTISKDGNVSLASTINDSTAGPILDFYRNSESPANADYLGQIKFQGENDAGQKIVYSKITGKIQDVEDGTEDGIIEFANKKAGNNVITARLRSDSLQLLNGTSLTVNGDLDVDGDTDLDNVIVSLASTFTGAVDANGGMDVSGGDGFVASSAKVTDLTDNNVVVAGVGGELEGDTNFTYDTMKVGIGTDLLVVGVATFQSTLQAASFLTGASGSAIGFNTNTITGPAQMFIDPAAIGDNTGSLRIKGDLFVDGTTTQINSTTLEIADFVVGIASTATTDTLADGAGINIGPDNTFKYDHTNTSLKSSENLNVASGKTYKINGTDVLSATTLGGAVVSSSLTSVGTLGALTVSGDVSIADKIVHTGDTNTAIRFPDDDTITAETGGSERLRIASDGKVGIGTVAPATTLDVQGDMAVAYSATHALRFYNQPKSNWSSISNTDTGSNANLSLKSSQGEAMFITYDKKIGIGTNNPGHNLHVHGSFPDFAISDSDTTNDKFRILHNGGGTQLQVDPNNVGPNVSYLLATIDGTERLRITSSGQILSGIATARDNLANNASGVEAQFQIEGTSFTTSTLSIIRNSADKNDGGIILGKTRSASTYGNTAVQAGDDLGNLTFAGSDGTSLQFGAEIVAEVRGGVGNDDLPTDLKFFVNSGTTVTSERFRITHDGKIGIGITNPDKNLEIRSNSSPTIRINNSDTSISSEQTIGAIEFKAEDGSSHGSQVTGSIESISQAAFTGQGSPSHLIFKTNGVSGADALAERLRITYAGKIGIGTDNPVGNLEVRDSKANLIVAKDGLTVKSNSDLHTTYDMLQIGAGGALASYSTATATADTQFIHNAYRHSGGTFKYRYADSAARIRMNSPAGAIIFDNAASGSADGDITFSERLRIDADGRVGIGTNNPGSVLDIQRAAAGSEQMLQIRSHATAAGNFDGDYSVEIRHATSTVTHGMLISNKETQDVRRTLDVADGNGVFATFTNSKVGIGITNPAVKLAVSSTDAIQVPVGTTLQRPTGAAGYIRYNSSIASYEGHNGSEWAGIGGAAEVETTVSSTSATTCESFEKATYRSASIIAQITQGSNYQVGNYLLIHDGTTVTLIEESAVATGDMLGSFTAVVSGSNVVFQVNMASASSATVTTKMTKVSIP